jgi:hypothetical protein
MSSKKYLISTMGRDGYQKLPKAFRDTIEHLDKLPTTPKPVTIKQINEALSKKN